MQLLSLLITLWRFIIHHLKYFVICTYIIGVILDDTFYISFHQILLNPSLIIWNTTVRDGSAMNTTFTVALIDCDADLLEMSWALMCPVSVCRFWNHFQTELPVHRPDWDQFLQQEASTQEPDTPQDEAQKWSLCVVLWIWIIAVWRSSNWFLLVSSLATIFLF